MKTCCISYCFGHRCGTYKYENKELGVSDSVSMYISTLNLNSVRGFIPWLALTVSEEIISVMEKNRTREAFSF